MRKIVISWPCDYAQRIGFFLKRPHSSIAKRCDMISERIQLNEAVSRNPDSAMGFQNQRSIDVPLTLSNIITE